MSNVPKFQCSDDPMFKCSNVPMFQCVLFIRSHEFLVAVVVVAVDAVVFVFDWLEGLRGREGTR